MFLDDHKKDLLGFAYICLCACIALNFLYRTLTGAMDGTLFLQVLGNSGFAFIDYDAFYSAGKIVLSPERASIYDPAVQLKYYNENILIPFCGKTVSDIPLGQSVPWFFTLMGPFALMPLVPSFVVWNLIGGGLSILGLMALMKQRGVDARFKRVFLIGMLGSYPTQWLIHDGQNSWLILAPLCLYLWGWAAGKNIPGGAGLACMIIKPWYALFMAIPALACKKWKLLCVALIVGSIHLGSAISVFGIDTILKYNSALSSTESTNPAVFPTWMVSLRGPLSIVMPKDTAFVISGIVFGVTFVGLLAFWFISARHASQAKMRVAFAISLLACLLSSPHCHFYDLVIFAAVAACTMESVEWFKASNQTTWSKIWSRTLVLYPIISFLIYVAADLKATPEIRGVGFFVLDLWLLFVACKWYAQPGWLPDAENEASPITKERQDGSQESAAA